MVIEKFMPGKRAIIVVIITCIFIPLIIYCPQLIYILYPKQMHTMPDTVGTGSYDEQLGIATPEEVGIDNIVLFGVDNRTPNDSARTDSIIIATFDKSSKVIKLTSIMRDLYVPIGSTKSMERINTAYTIGGPELTLRTLNKNFGLDLKYYAVIDFTAFQYLVDKLGGIDVEIKAYEVKEINYYIKNANWSNPLFIKGSGFQHLNGQQALSFARIRKVGNGDWERIQRQRLVLKCLVEKVKQTNITKAPELLTTLVSYIHTNISLSKIISLGIAAYRFNNNIESIRIPVDGYCEDQYVNGASVLVPDIGANALFLKRFIYDMKAPTNKDVPTYMQNNFHVDDNSSTWLKPKPNIPNYSTPDIPFIEEE